MFFWYLGLSFALVLIVFDSPLLDYRLVMVGSVLPWLDHLWAPPWVMHSVLFPVAGMTVAMLAGWGRRLVQRRWLGLSIGLFVHLVLSASFARSELFWWPVRGFDVDDLEPPMPGLAVGLVLEVIGLCALVFWYRRLGLHDPTRRRHFARTGNIDRALLRA